MSLDIRYLTNGEKNVYVVVDAAVRTVNYYNSREEIPAQIRHYAPDGNPRFVGPDDARMFLAMNALYRPGPIKYIPNFINRKDGLEETVYDLEETKVIAPIPKEPKKPVVDKPLDKEETTETDDSILKEKDEKNKLPIILAGILLAFLIVLAVVYLLISNHDVKEVKVPDVTGLTLEEAIKKVEKQGLKYTTKDEENADIEEGKVIRTEPKAGSTKTKGSTITIVESSGKEYLLLEDYTGKNYYEIKAKLELKGIKVEMKTKEVENTSDYKDKEEQIIDQEPKFDKEKETKLYANDSVILYIPEVDVYPDMVKEKWTLSKVQDFAKENNLTLDITYKETTDVEENIVLSQGRDPGDPIYNGYTLKITISKKPEDKTEPTDSLMPKDDKKDKKTE